MSRKEGFLDRWSRLKQTDDPLPEEPEAPPPAPVEDDRSDDEILADLGLPHPEELKPGDDVTGFMAKTVPDRLRRMALRQLWRSNPVLANVDGLVEYGEDYTDGALVVENLQTLYQVGKGMFVEDPPDAPEEEVETAEDAALAEEAADAPEEDDPAEDPPEIEEVFEVEAEPEAAMAELAPQPTRRRMRFS